MHSVKQMTGSIKHCPFALWNDDMKLQNVLSEEYYKQTYKICDNEIHNRASVSMMTTV